MQPWEDWDHVVKIDPDKTLLNDESVTDVGETGTDAIIVGGTMGMTEEKMTRVIEACRNVSVPVFIEPSGTGVVVHSDALDGYLIPVVMNAGDISWLTGMHKEWVRLDDSIDWTHTFPEAYVVLNPDSSVGELTAADCDLDSDDIAAYAEVAEQLFGQSIIYLEYSGMLGEPSFVKSTADALDSATLFYGGGIHDYDSAYEMGQYADTIIVGDLVHDEGIEAVRETVRGVHDAK
ncbi:phosphoglycerol geranylgeranyltransferase [Halocatena pleomorpha]|uniref:Geranylgeranylglyceryl phosphate synthase n=1 Tax=Halocatena pleomorpha TaxID=1785090 RepID=A0A3P3R4X6_9EURY|nr:putative phosphoglycerol geranylgeranyltransferase [Halocatena pleomorpha]RRJ28404.1 putative phosphoglycerol geranylgeranyltransferase [Halocatena pleomorpha]